MLLKLLWSAETVALNVLIITHFQQTWVFSSWRWFSLVAWNKTKALTQRLSFWGQEKIEKNQWTRRRNEITNINSCCCEAETWKFSLCDQCCCLNRACVPHQASLHGPKVKRKTPTTPSHGRHAREFTWRRMTISNHASPRGDGGRVGDGRRVPPEAPPHYKSLLMGRKTGLGVGVCQQGPLGPRGRLCLHALLTKTNVGAFARVLCLCAWTNKQIKGGAWYNMVESRGGNKTPRDWRKARGGEWTVFDKPTTICLDCSCFYTRKKQI